MAAGATGMNGVNARVLAVVVFPFKAVNAITLRQSMEVPFVPVNEFDT